MEKFYSKIFTTPRKRYSVALGVITIIFTSILNGISKAFFIQRYFFLGLFIIIAILVLGRFINLAFNNRRAFFLSLLILISIEFFDIIVIHTGFPNLIVVAPASIASILTITFYFTSEADEKKVCFLSFLMLLLFYPINHFYSFNAPHRIQAYFLISLIGVFIGYLYIKYLDKDFGFNVKEFLKAFLLFWLTTNPTYFERKLEEIGVKKGGWVMCLSIGDVKLVSTSFHPGPLRNIGGVRIVEKILEMGNTMYLHSATTHDNNLVSNEEVEKVISQISCDGDEIEAMEPYIEEGDKFKLIVFPFSKVKLIVVSGKDAIDDLPVEIQKFAEKFGEVWIVDAHDSFKEEYDISDEDIEEIKNLIEKAMNKVNENKVLNLKYAFVKKRVESKNICGYLALLVLDYGEKRYAMLMIDSNNIDKDFRIKIEEFLENEGFNPVVISTDNHSKTGVSPKIGYKPVGDDESDVRAVFDFLEKLDIKLKEGKIKYEKRNVIAKVMGEKFFGDVEKAFLQLGQKSLYLFFFIVVFQVILAILLGIAIL